MENCRPPGWSCARTATRSSFGGSSIFRSMNGTDTAIDSLLLRLSIYGVPFVIGVISLVALFAWDSQYAGTGGTNLEFRYLEETGVALRPAQALAQLTAAPTVQYHDTRLSEFPIWISFAVPAAYRSDATEVELPSRHAVDIACWNASNLNAFGSANRHEAVRRIKAAKAGFALELGRLYSAVTVLCRGTFAGPARISVVQWPVPEFDTSIRKFHFESGLLDGGFIVLFVFVLLTAIINREWVYVLFAAWLVTNLRLAALSSGWDTQWLARAMPSEWVFLARKLNIAVYYMLTYTLFRRLFKDDLKRVGYPLLLSMTGWSCLPLLLLAVILPYSRYLPFMWATAAFGTLVLAFFLARILLVTRSRVAMWYTASLGIALFASLNEIISAALGVKTLIGTVNSVTAALSSSLLAALAIAEQIREERLAKVKAQAELRSTYEAIPIGLFTLDQDGALIAGNPALREMLRAGLFLNNRKHWSDFFEPGAWGRLQDLASGRAGQEIEIRSTGGSGHDPRWFLVKATVSKDRIEGSLQDITDRYEATERLRFLAENDPLTGVLNRRGIETVLGETIDALADDGPLAIAYLDLDRFKLINDLYGHLAGDEVLKQLCLRIKGTLPRGCDIGRVGGDEFVIVFQNTPVRSGEDICRQVIERIGLYPYQIGDKAFQVKGSIGLIEVGGSLKVKDAISAADRACRAAKSGHHGGLVVYEKNASLFREREEELRLIERLGVGVAPEGLFLVMQPIMSLRAPYESLNFEILLRMREADNSVTQAGKIILTAENNGRIGVIDRWVLSNALKWLDTHGRELKKTRFVCLNLSGASLNDERFIQDAFSIMANFGSTVERLCVEITESVALHDLENTRRFIDRVKALGAKVALDDFGAGYTSFNYLKELPADVLKIDGAFVRDVNRHPSNLTIVETIAELARNLGMKTIAEWAEDLAAVEILSTVGVDYVQGYAIARPQHPDKILGAGSSADFIEDEKVAMFVRDSLAAAQTMELWEQAGGPTNPS